MSTIVSPVDAARTWLERIMTSNIIGFVVRDETNGLMQCVDGDPDLRMALIEWQTQRIRELERSQRQAGPVTYPGREAVPLLVLDRPIDPALAGFAPDGAGGQAGDDDAFAEMARQMANAGTDLSTSTSGKP